MPLQSSSVLHGKNSSNQEVIKPYAKSQQQTSGSRHHAYYFKSDQSATDYCRLIPGQDVTIDVVTTPSRPSTRVHGQVIDITKANIQHPTKKQHQVIIAVDADERDNKPERVTQFFRSLPAKAKLIYKYNSPFSWLIDHFSFSPS